VWPPHLKAWEATTVRLDSDSGLASVLQQADATCDRPLCGRLQHERDTASVRASQQFFEWQTKRTWLVTFLLSHDMSMPTEAACAIAKSGGRTPFARAQAIRSANMRQQQARQQCSAVRHPQVEPAHGNCPSDNAARLPAGSGIPAAVITKATNRIAETQR
jgi:hypothetical protein